MLNFRKADFSFRNVEWPAWSPDIFYPDFFLRGYLKERGYKDNPKAFTELKEAIGKEITRIGSEVTKAVIDSVKKRAKDCIQLGGHHLKNVVFENQKSKNH